jgi:DNA-binding LytR/AlgR family response regulator
MNGACDGKTCYTLISIAQHQETRTMKLLIAEDEDPAFHHLLQMLREVNFHYDDYVRVESVAEFRKWILENPEPDLMLLDVQLQDGKSLDLFDEMTISCPVIFITAFDSFVVESFKAHSLNYILKPLHKDHLKEALQKYYHVAMYYRRLGETAQSKKERILVRKGSARTSLLVNDIAFFYSETKLVFAVDFNGDRYYMDHSLNQIEETVSLKQFFRVSRQVIVNIKAIKEFRSIEFSKIELFLIPNPWIKKPITISQFTAPQFKEWIDNL